MTDNRMTEQTATERLRALLDERSVKYEAANAWWTSWDTDGASSIGAVVYCEDLGDGLEIRWHTITPEQAIAATLGIGECEYVIEDNMNESEGMGDVWFRCTNCGTCYDIADNWLLKMPHCPKCGATVKGVR